MLVSTAVVIVLLLVVSAFFCVAETAVSRGRRHQLEKVGHTFEVMRRQRNQMKALRIVPSGVTAKPSPLPRATA
ncbi:MAG TPA: hypothetical protein VFQ69_00425 [Rhizomicrobium sp.]|nr:hypothetical protein [Rhizomicrobium sp.]